MMRLANLHMNEFNSIQFNSIQFNSIQFNSICNNFKFYFFINSCNFINILCLLFNRSLFCYKYFYFSFKFLKINFGKKHSIFECIL